MNSLANSGESLTEMNAPGASFTNSRRGFPRIHRYVLACIWLSFTASTGLVAQTLSKDDRLAVYRSANEALENQRYSEAQALFCQVVLQNRGTPLALEAGFFELYSKHKLVDGQAQRWEELAHACDDWQCAAQSWLESATREMLARYRLKLNERIESVLVVESQAAFASGQWLRTLDLLDQQEQPDQLEQPDQHQQRDLRDRSAANSEAADKGPLNSSPVNGSPANGSPVNGSPAKVATAQSVETIRRQLVRLECYIHLNRWLEAEKSAEALQVIAQEKLTQTPPPAWIEGFLLRQAEVAVVLGKWSGAESNVWNIRTHFPECNATSQVDYLQARCLVHDAKFEEARQLLASTLASKPPPAVEMQRKLWWTIAETYLMQRKFPDAYAAYEQVAKLGVDTPWAGLAHRQMSVCLQASGKSVASETLPNKDASLRSTQKQTPEQPR